MKKLVAVGFVLALSAALMVPAPAAAEGGPIRIIKKKSACSVVTLLRTNGVPIPEVVQKIVCGK